MGRLGILRYGRGLCHSSRPPAIMGAGTDVEGNDYQEYLTSTTGFVTCSLTRKQEGGQPHGCQS